MNLQIDRQIDAGWIAIFASNAFSISNKRYIFGRSSEGGRKIKCEKNVAETSRLNILL